VFSHTVSGGIAVATNRFGSLILAVAAVSVFPHSAALSFDFNVNVFEDLFRNENVAEKNRKLENEARNSVLERYPPTDYFVGFSRPIHFREGARYTIEIWAGTFDENDAARIAANVYEDYDKTKSEGAKQGIDISRTKPVTIRQTFVEHWEGVGPAMSPVPRSWIFLRSVVETRKRAFCSSSTR